MHARDRRRRPAPNWKPQPSAAWSQHLRERTDVQNIDLMNLAGFCRNCLSPLVSRGRAEAQGLALTDPEAREIVYGMPYKEWQAQAPDARRAPEQKAAFAAANPGH